MTSSAEPVRYRYVADGRLLAGLDREAARLRNPLLLMALVLAGILFGVGASLLTNAASLPYYLGRVLLIGLVWGLVWGAGLAVIAGGLLVPVLRITNRRMVARLFPTGSATEVELGADSLVVRRPNGTRTVPYPAIFRVRESRFWLGIEIRGRLIAELLPPGLLPDEAIEFVRARARGRSPAADVPGTPTRRLVVPSGWATHVAAVHTGASLRSSRFWIRLGVALVVSVPLAVVAGPGWLLVAPLLALLSVAVTYARTRRMITTVLPTGSVATTEFLDDRFISRNAGGTREIRFEDIEALQVRGDVVLLTLASRTGRMLIARALIPEDALERLR